jgi:hypothetical protein
VCPAKWSKTEDDLPLRSAEAFILAARKTQRFSCHEVFEALGLEGNDTTKPPKARKKHGNTAPSARKFEGTSWALTSLALSSAS